jgi:ribonuclease P protein subunit POP4
MSITKQNVFRHELIGLKAKVIGSSDPGLLGASGKIIDETKETLVVEVKGAPKVIPKSSSKFQIGLPSGGEVVVPGRRILGRPEDRVRR